MGVDLPPKDPPLPVPTETETTTPTDLTTDLASKPGDDKSSYSLPEDGNPVTIRTRGHKARRSQTSLLIEYFEGSKSSSPGSVNRKPSVRVRLTPSKKSKGDRIQVTETKGSRKASLSRRIPLEHAIAAREIDLSRPEDAASMTSYASATEESNLSANPIDIEIDRHHRRRRPASPLIPSADSYHPGNPSDISAIPTDSFLDGPPPADDLKRPPSPFAGDSLVAPAAAALATATLPEAGSNKPRTKERVKISDSPTTASKDRSKERPDRKRRSASKTSGFPDRGLDEPRSPRSRSGRSRQESNLSAADSTVLSSNPTMSHRSMESRSVRSAASRSSINNPKLLETVEDAIRRLILPELSALKREQSKRESRRGSLTSTATEASRDDASTDRRRSSAHRSQSGREGARHKERRNREARHDYHHHSLPDDPFAMDHSTLTDDPSRPGGSFPGAALFKASVVPGAAAVADTDDHLSATARAELTDSSGGPHHTRRPRRADSPHRRHLGPERDQDAFGDDEDEGSNPGPPMPLMSDINPSDMTRTSILSADTDGPRADGQDLTPVRHSSHLTAAEPSPSSTPTRPRTPLDLQRALGTNHANVSHGDLMALPRGRPEDVAGFGAAAYGPTAPATRDLYQDLEDGSRALAPEPVDDFEDRYFATQVVPPPLNYVPYQAGARGLSPIPSVSGYTEAGSEAPLPQNSTEPPFSPHSAPLSSPGKSPEPTRPLGAVPSSPDSGPAALLRGRILQQPQPLAARETGVGAADGTRVEHPAAGQAVRGIGANPDLVHLSSSGLESAVASLVEGSTIDQSILTAGSSGDHNGLRGSTMSYDDPSKPQSSRGMSPEKMSLDSRRELEDERRGATPGSRSLGLSQDFSEYEIDEYGRKVPRQKYRHSPTASEAAITAGAVGAAAAALKAAQERNQGAANEESFQPAGVARNKSFKERTLHGWQPRNTPTHSFDRLDFEAPPNWAVAGVPGGIEGLVSNAEYSDERSPLDRQLGSTGEKNPSHQLNGNLWFGCQTPTRRGNLTAGLSLDASEVMALGSAAAAAAAAAAVPRSLEPGQEHHDEWRRTSDERKRDTLVTNPFEDASPVVNPALHEDILGSRHFEAPFHLDSPRGLASHKYDEGYMSNGPNRTPEGEPKGKAVGPSAGMLPDADGGGDPFYTSKTGHARHLSGMSQGMSPAMYDAATGTGIDRIENKDIVALMQHLVVRDAQRSARDTEIVALLMNAALEMRNSFREMKELVQDTGDDLIFANVENTEKLQKAINGPRPYPGTATRSLQSGSFAGMTEEAAVAAKKKNLWRRALQGLSARGTSDLSRIEDMLMQLLGEVDILKTQTAPAISTNGPNQSYDEALAAADGHEHDRDYEHQSMPPMTQAARASQDMPISPIRAPPAALTSSRRVSDHRASTMEDADKKTRYETAAEVAVASAAAVASSPVEPRTNPNLLTPGRPDHIRRGGSAPVETPPQLTEAAEGQPLSAENTPRTEKGRKHKSSSSSGWLPKISRWSETTASSVGRVLRGSANSKKGNAKYDDYQPPSRSGSSLASYEDNYRHDPYGEDKLHSGFSDLNLMPQVETRGTPPRRAMTAAMAVTAATTTTPQTSPDDAKYKAHRNSVNLQHPQPRSGQTERFRTALETSAQDYTNPTTPRSTEWAGSASSLGPLAANGNRLSNTSSSAAVAAAAAMATTTTTTATTATMTMAGPGSGPEPDYWNSSPGGPPPRPPKEALENAALSPSARAGRLPQLKEKASQTAAADAAGRYNSSLAGTQASFYPESSNSSPGRENRNLNAALGIPGRKPSGPRAMTPRSPESEALREGRRRKRDTFGTVTSAEADTY